MFWLNRKFIQIYPDCTKVIDIEFILYYRYKAIVMNSVQSLEYLGIRYVYRYRSGTNPLNSAIPFNGTDIETAS